MEHKVRRGGGIELTGSGELTALALIFLLGGG
jgi:hypothetical protein